MLDMKKTLTKVRTQAKERAEKKKNASVSLSQDKAEESKTYAELLANILSEAYSFENKNIRVAMDDKNEPWFCLKDICGILEIKNHRDVVERLKEKGVASIDTLTDGGNQNMLFINEGNLSRCISNSRSPKAELLMDKIYDEILPSIRKTGTYTENKTPLSPTEILLQQTQLLVDYERRLKQNEQELTNIKGLLEADNRKLSIHNLISKVPVTSYRKSINAIVRHAASIKANSQMINKDDQGEYKKWIMFNIETNWKLLYSQIYDKLGINVSARCLFLNQKAEKAGIKKEISKLDVIEQLGEMEFLLNLTIKTFYEYIDNDLLTRLEMK
jgi:prophage antirepressor-like protein